MQCIFSKPGVTDMQKMYKLTRKSAFLNEEKARNIGENTGWRHLTKKVLPYQVNNGKMRAKDSSPGANPAKK